MNPRSAIKHITALLFVLIFLAGSMAHVWHHCCEGWHTTLDSSASSLCHTYDPSADHRSTLAEYGSVETNCCRQHEGHSTDNALNTRQELSTRCALDENNDPESGYEDLAVCLMLLPGERAVIHHPHHACCEHNLSPVIDEAVTKKVVNSLIVKLSQFPFNCTIPFSPSQSTLTDSPPSTLLRTGRQLLASHCVLRR